MALKLWQRKLRCASKSSPRRPRWRPSIEALEVRCTPSISAGLVGRVLQVTCGNSGNVVAVSHNVSTASTNVNGQTFADASFDSIHINNSFAADIDNIFGLPAKPLNITGGGPNTVNLGNSVDGLRDMLGPVNVTNPPSLTTLNLNDNPGGSGNGFTVTVSASGGVGTISFSGTGHPATVTYNTGDVSALSIDGLGDTFNVQSTAGSGGMTIVDALTVNLGNTSNGVQNLSNPVTVSHPVNGGTLNINDGPDTGARTATLSASGITATLAGLAPTTITYSSYLTSSGGVKIIAGHAADVINVLSTTDTLDTVFDSSGGADTLNVGNASNGLQSILGQLLVKNTPNASILNLNDGADTTAQTVNLQQNGPLGFVTGLGTQLGIEYVVGDLSALNVTAGRAADTINVLSTAAGIPVRLDSSGGSDKVVVGNSSNGVQSILGPLAVHNAHATSSLTLNDFFDAGGRNITMSVSGDTGTVSGLAPAPITYAGGDVNSLTLQVGSAVDSVNVPSTAAGVPLALEGNLTSTVVLGNGPAGVRGIVGPVSVTGFFIDVEDLEDTFGRTVVMNAGSDTATITGLAPATITYGTMHTPGLSVFGGSGGNTFFVQSTPASLNTFLFAGSGNDTITVGSSANTLDGIQGFLDVDGQGGSNTLNINDQGSTGHTVTVTSTTVQRSGSAPIEYHNIQVLNVHPGSPAPVPGLLPDVDVESTDVKTAVEVDASNDAAIRVGNASDSLADLQGPLNVVGQGGTVALNVMDDGTATAQGYTLDQGSLTRAGAASITYAGIQQLVVNGAAGDSNLFDVNGVQAGTPTTINTGTGANDLVRMRGQGMIGDALTLNGQGQNARVGYVAYTKDVYINLQTGVGTDLANFSGIHDITGGQGNNILVGDGSQASINANLSGGSAGRNLIITGGGTGTVFGSGNGDLLIGATTAYDHDQNGELQDILAEWTRTDLSYSDRVNHILNGDDPLDPYPLNASTVSDNGAANTITGNSNSQVVNLYFVTNNDVITDLTAGEVVINISGGAPPAPGRNGRRQPDSATLAPSFVEPSGPAGGVQAPVLATLSLATTDLATQLAAYAMSAIGGHGSWSIADLAWSGNWQPESLGDLTGY